MSGKDRPRNVLDGMIHRHYQDWAVGDGATTEFPLSHTVLRGEDVLVFVSGIAKRPSQSGTAYDYAIRGITPGYNGDTNRIKFTVPPAPGAPILFFSAAG
jgi:hypothetical protein